MLNLKNIPIYFINRNRLSALSKMISWLKGNGYNNIKIIDNNSNYAPLLEYYDSINGVVDVIRLDRNGGPWIFWELGFHRQMESTYIVSDSDLYPCEFCPADLISNMYGVLQQHSGIDKVAPGLNLENISTSYQQGELAYKWESQFWHRPVGRGVFAAGVDTTFAMYRSGSDFTNDPDKNLRLGYPYLLEHSPWLVNDSCLDSEEVHYRAHAEKGFSYWSSSSEDLRLTQSDYIKNYTEKKILHLGCGNEYIPGWINIDVSGRKLDINLDLDKLRTDPLNFENDSIDGFYMSHVFEHIKDTLALMEELYRVAKHGAKFFMRIPYGSSNDAWEDPTHVRSYFESSFVYYSQPAYSKADYGYQGDWQVEQITLIVSSDLIKQGADIALKAIRHSRNTVNEMIVELTAIKPKRPRHLELMRGGKVILTSNSLISPDF